MTKDGNTMVKLSSNRYIFLKWVCCFFCITQNLNKKMVYITNSFYHYFNLVCLAFATKTDNFEIIAHNKFKVAK